MLKKNQIIFTITSISWSKTIFLQSNKGPCFQSYDTFHNIHNDFIICILHGSWQKSLLISSFSKQSIMIFYVLNQFMRHRKYKHIHQHVTCQNKAKTTRTIQTVRIHNLQIAHNNTLCLKMFRKFGKLVVPSCEAIGRRYGDVAPTQQFKLPKGKLENHSVHSKIIPFIPFIHFWNSKKMIISTIEINRVRLLGSVAVENQKSKHKQHFWLKTVSNNST